MANTLPRDFIERIKKQFPNDFEEILGTFEKRKPTTFRVNTLKSSEKQIQEKLASEGFEIEKANGFKNAFVLKNKTQRELTETDMYKNGEIYLQNLSSQIPVNFLDPKPNETVLDICAAPGSKTTQMAAMMENSGQIVANDMSKIRLYKLLANLKTLGVTNTKTTHFRAQDMWRKFPNVFDKVLVDVPCSLEGRFLISNPKTYKDWSVKKIKRLASYQKQILHSSVSCTKPGGTIVYSTCTIAPEENEEVIEWLIKKHGEMVRLEKMERILPTDIMEAFFIAKFLKI